MYKAVEAFTVDQIHVIRKLLGQSTERGKANQISRASELLKKIFNINCHPVHQYQIKKKNEWLNARNEGKLEISYYFFLLTNCFIYIFTTRSIHLLSVI